MIGKNFNAQDILLSIIICTSIIIFVSETVYIVYLLTCSLFNSERRYQLPRTFRHFIWIKTTIIFLTISIYPSISGAIIVYVILIFLYDNHPRPAQVAGLFWRSNSFEIKYFLPRYIHQTV